MEKTTHKFLTPPPRVGGKAVLHWRQDRDDRFTILVHNPDNPWHKFVVARWYPWNGDVEWAAGKYIEKLPEAWDVFNATR